MSLRASPARARARPAIELLLMVALVEIALWLPYEPQNEPLRWLLGAAIAIVAVASHLRWRQGGGTAVEPAVGRRRAWAEAALATLAVAAAVAVWLAAVREPYDGPDLAFLGSAAALAEWTGRRLALAALQQLFLQLFFQRVLWEILGNAWAATLLAAALFGAFHLPGPALAVATGLSAVVWIWLYRRSRRLLPLILSHAVLAGLASVAVPERLFYEMRAGARATDSLATYRLLAREETRSLLRGLTSPEYLAFRGGTDDGYVRGLYRDVLGRPAFPEEVREQTARLRQTSRGAVAKAMVASGELSDAAESLRWRSLDYLPMKPGLLVRPGSDQAIFVGWFDAELEWRWAQSAAPAIRFRLDREPARPYLLELECGAFAPQEVELELNGRPLGRVAFSALDPETHRLVVTPDHLADGGNELRFRTSGERVSSAGDPRALGLGFRQLRLEPLRFPSASITFLDDDFLAGFSVAEESLRWTQEPVARLVYPLRRVEAVETYGLRLDAGTLGRQDVEVALNGTPIARWTLESMEPQVRTATFEANLLHPGANEVELRLPDARSREGDPRLLGVALVSIRIYPSEGGYFG